MTDAIIGYGGAFETLDESTSPAAWIRSGEVVDFNLPPLTVDSIDCSAECAPGEWREYLPGLKNGGDVTVNMNYTASERARLHAELAARETKSRRIYFPDGTYYEFTAFMIALDTPVPLADRITMAARYKMTGEPGAFVIAEPPTPAPSNFAYIVNPLAGVF